MACSDNETALAVSNMVREEDIMGLSTFSALDDCAAFEDQVYDFVPARKVHFSDKRGLQSDPEVFLSPSRTVRMLKETPSGANVSPCRFQIPDPLPFSLSTPSPLVLGPPRSCAATEPASTPFHQLGPTLTLPSNLPQVRGLSPLQGIQQVSPPLQFGVQAPRLPQPQVTPDPDTTWVIPERMPVYSFAIKTGPSPSAHVKVYAMVTPGNGVSCQFFQQQIFMNDMFMFNPFLKSRSCPAMTLSELKQKNDVFLANEMRKRKLKPEACLRSSIVTTGELLKNLYSHGTLTTGNFAHSEFLKVYIQEARPLAARILFPQFPLETLRKLPLSSVARQARAPFMATPAVSFAPPAGVVAPFQEARAPVAVDEPNVEVPAEEDEEVNAEVRRNEERREREEKVKEVMAEVAIQVEDVQDEGEEVGTKDVEFYKNVNNKLRQEKKSKQETLNKLVSLVDSLNKKLNSYMTEMDRIKTSQVLKQVEGVLRKFKKDEQDQMKVEFGKIGELINKFWSDFQRVKNKTSATESNIQKELGSISSQLKNLNQGLQNRGPLPQQSSYPSAPPVLFHQGNMLQPGGQFQGAPCHPGGQLREVHRHPGAPLQMLQQEEGRLQEAYPTGPPPTLPHQFRGDRGWGQ